MFMIGCLVPGQGMVCSYLVRYRLRRRRCRRLRGRLGVMISVIVMMMMIMMVLLVGHLDFPCLSMLGRWNDEWYLEY